MDLSNGFIILAWFLTRFFQPSSSNFLDGSCPLVPFQNVSFNATGPRLFIPIYKVPFQYYDPPFAYFPSSTNHTISMTVENQIISHSFVHNSKCDVNVGLQVDNKLRTYSFIIHGYQFSSRVQFNIKVQVIMKHNILIIWGCVDLVVSKTFEETLWVLHDMDSISLFANMSTSSKASLKMDIIRALNSFSTIKISQLKNAFYTNNEALVFKIEDEFVQLRKSNCEKLQSIKPEHKLKVVPIIFYLFICGLFCCLSAFVLRA